MELFSLSSPRITSTLPSRRFLTDKSSFISTLNNDLKKNPESKLLKFGHARAQFSGKGSRKHNVGVVKAVVKEETQSYQKKNKEETQSKDDVVFVAGATGKVGSRTVRELLKLGFQVRAGVRSAQKADKLVQSVQEMKLDEGVAAVEKLKIVECDLEKDGIEEAIGNASVVICCIGASEKEIFDVTGPCRIDYRATKSLIDAATSARVDHFILVTSLGTNKIGFPAAILNLFWGVLIWKRKAEEALIASGLPYTIVRPGGMERPTDAYKETHNLTLAEGDTLFGGQVSNLQVAELMAFMAKNRSLSYCKVVEVVAETTAPLTPMGDLLAKLPSDRVDTSANKKATPTVQETRLPDPVPSQITAPEASIAVVEKEPSQTKVQISRPLSPYFIYEDLKPPTSPTPTPPPSSKPTPSTTLGSTKAVELDVLEATLEVDDLKSPMSPTPTSPGDAMVEISAAQVETGTTTGATEVSVEVPKTRPLSPYAVYEDLKPPTSPSSFQATATGGITNVILPVEAAPPSTETSSMVETTPTEVTVKEVLPIKTEEINAAQVETGTTTGATEVSVEVPKTRPLSPYAVYEDLKPPTSPSSFQATAKGGITNVIFPVEAAPSSTETSSMVETIPAEVTEKEVSPIKTEETTHLSPYHAYDDLKPPTSPSPSAPTASFSSQPKISDVPDTSAAETPKSDEPVVETNTNEPKARPLSPFTMYEDLKPPTSPIIAYK
ncbi:hypothetical protein MKW94_023119 [Papaver nudicaule]|uniref:NAD(P)-binding domain-containing protein n=1 Tax=Papaver nudicaule TaxID=74823 RepID=A0AA42ARD1_PAPNU|nr:hypothetical protein [Papaver nudicaule]